MGVTGRTLVDGTARGEMLRFEGAISFWGGVDPVTGMVSDPRHPQFKMKLKDRIIALPDTVGSSSSSAILLELMRNRMAPAGVIVRTVDAILVLGVVVGMELGYASLPVVEVGEAFDSLPVHGTVTLDGNEINWRDSE